MGKLECWYCGRELTLQSGQKNTLTKDHVIPRSADGRDDHDNLVAACRRCNCRKGTKTLLQFRYMMFNETPYQKAFLKLCEAYSVLEYIDCDPDGSPSDDLLDAFLPLDTWLRTKAGALDSYLFHGEKLAETVLPAVEVK